MVGITYETLLTLTNNRDLRTVKWVLRTGQITQDTGIIVYDELYDSITLYSEDLEKFRDIGFESIIAVY